MFSLIPERPATFFLSLWPGMASIKQFYKNNINGLIFTLLFHIILFGVLNLSQFRVKRVFEEAELMIDFPEEPLKQDILPVEPTNGTDQAPSAHQTNIASNRMSAERNDKANGDLQREIDQARQLVRDVSEQLSKDVPTIDNLKMPVETTEGLDPDSLKKKLYTGDSNIEYYLENRFHRRLPKPIYLAFDGGKVEVQIVVNQQGKVIEANPVITSGQSSQILSYAKTAALQTVFNSDPQAPQKQNGKIIYHFVAQ